MAIEVGAYDICIAYGARSAAIALWVALMSVGAPATAATCTAPAPFELAAEERTLADGDHAVVVVRASGDGQLAAGDVIRQANATRIARCGDLEAAAQDARARGVVLLLAVERGGVLLATAAPTGDRASQVARAPAAPPIAAPASQQPPVRPAPTPTPPPRRTPVLPARGDVGSDVTQRAAAAATALAAVDAAAQSTVPLLVYERRLGDAEATIAQLAFPVGAADSAVSDFVEEILALHRTARAVRRLLVEELQQAGIDRRAVAARTLPYFSGSRVTEWVSIYPFLAPTILEEPRATRMLPGESSGRWDAERALELLWDHAHAATTELAAWARG